MKVAVLTIGTELLNGQVADTNTRFIAEKLNDTGIVVCASLCVPDEQDAILRALSFLYKSAHVVITSGGLGPTVDDLTRESVALFFNKKLSPDAKLKTGLQEKFKTMMCDMPVENNKQALYIEDSVVIDNPSGTAPGFYLSSEGRTIASFPGVPSELSVMLPVFLTELNKSLKKQAPAVLHLLTAGLPESLLDQSFKVFCEKHDILLGTIARFGQVDLRFSSDSLEKESIRVELLKFMENKDMLRRAVFSMTPDISLEAVIIRLLKDNNLSLSVAESCTGGMLSSMLTAVPGASDVFWGGAVSYANEAKNKFLGVSESIIEKYGAVSFECAHAMCKGVAEASGSDLALSITGIAGPGGGTPDKPVGTVFISFRNDSGNYTFHFRFWGNRTLVRRFSSFRAMAIIHEYIRFGDLNPDNWPSLIDWKKTDYAL